MTPEEEIVVLRSIVRRAKSTTWWARLSFPTHPKYWNAEEREVLARVFGRR